jgi:TonB family protein
MTVPVKNGLGPAQLTQRGVFPTYCFDAQRPVLLGVLSFGTVLTQFSKTLQTQGKYIAGEIDFREGKRNILSAKVETITALSANDPALIPPEALAVTKLNRLNLNAGMAVGMLKKKTVPAYPEDAKNAGLTGTVVLQAIIGGDGRIHDLEVVSAPCASMAASSFWAVSQWEYSPYLLNGEPVAVETTVNVTFSLGG